MAMKGIAGGSALVGGLSQMEISNPYALGVAMTHASYEHTGVHPDDNDLAHVTGMTGITLQRLLHGQASKEVDTKGLQHSVSGQLSDDTFSKTMKNMRGAYAQNGISSKEIGYQLANQAYAENRLDESQLVTAHKSLDMVFDNGGYVTAQKILTGRQKGNELVLQRKAAPKPTPKPKPKGGAAAGGGNTTGSSGGGGNVVQGLDGIHHNSLPPNPLPTDDHPTSHHSGWTFGSSNTGNNTGGGSAIGGGTTTGGGSTTSGGESHVVGTGPNPGRPPVWYVGTNGIGTWDWTKSAPK